MRLTEKDRKDSIVDIYSRMSPSYQDACTYLVGSVMRARKAKNLAGVTYGEIYDSMREDERRFVRMMLCRAVDNRDE